MEEEKGLNLMDIFRTILSQKWLAVIIAVAVTAVGILGIRFIYNPLVSEYVVKFNLNLPDFNNNYTYYKYDDGTVLYYVSMVTPESIEKVKATDKAFNDIDSEDLKLELSVENYVVTNSSASGTAETEKRFVLRANTRDFSNEKVARDFLKGIAEIPVKYLKDIAIHSGYYLDFAESAVDYETQIGNIKNQVEFLRGEYRNLINKYGYSFTVPSTGRSLQYYLLELDDYIGNNNNNNKIGNLLTEAKTNKYIKSEELKVKGGKYDLDLKEYRNNLEGEERTLERLLQVAAMDSGSASVVKAQSDLVEDYKKRIEDTTSYMENGVTNAEYEQKVNTVMEEVKAFTKNYETVLTEVYKKAAFVSYYDSAVIDTEGEMKLLTSCILSLAVGVIAALITAYAVGAAKLAKKNAPATEEEKSE